MLILIRATTRHKLYLTLRFIIIIALTGLIIFQLSGLFKGYTFSSGGWLKEDNPSGNSMRVEGDKNNNTKPKENKINNHKEHQKLNFIKEDFSGPER